jgi:microcystin-dependent protein
MLADGSAVSRTIYSDLWTLLGTTFGAGDGSTTFNLPDLRSKMIVGQGQGASLSNRVLAALGGEENHQLTIGELAAHSHPINDPQHAHTFDMTFGASAAGGGVGYLVTPGSRSTAAAGTGITVANTGGGSAHNNMPPFLVLVYIIKVSRSGGPTAQAPIADTTQSGLLRQVSGVVTDYVGGDNNCHPLSGFAVQKTGDTMTGALGGIFAITNLQIQGAWPKTGTINLPFKADLLVNASVSFYTSTTGAMTAGIQLDGATFLNLYHFFNPVSTHLTLSGSGIYRAVAAGSHTLGVVISGTGSASDSGDYATFGVTMIRVP